MLKERLSYKKESWFLFSNTYLVVLVLLPFLKNKIKFRYIYIYIYPIKRGVV